MTNAHRRKKSPDLVRVQLLESAALLALEKGWAAISLEAIASAAGVTKGGLFHHFPNKQALFEAVFSYLIETFDAAIAERMEADPEPHGRFTRAYVELTFLTDQGGGFWDSLWSSGEGTSLGQVWGQWLADQLDRHKATDGDLALEAVRFAADGVWAGRGANVMPRDAEALREHLVAMTRPDFFNG